MPLRFLISTWAAVAGFLVGLFEAFDRWDRSPSACVVAAIMSLIGVVGMTMTWKRAARMSNRAAVRRRRAHGNQASRYPLDPIVFTKLIDDLAAGQTIDAVGDQGNPAVYERGDAGRSTEGRERGDVARALAILDRAGVGNRPRKGDELVDK
jgi:hypothetical protein